MRRFDALQRPPQWLRAVLAGLLLAFALNTIAHATHSHDLAGSATTAHSIACGYCTTFGGLADVPARVNPIRLDLQAEIHVFHPAAAPFIERPASAAQPRAPPRS